MFDYIDDEYTYVDANIMEVADYEGITFVNCKLRPEAAGSTFTNCLFIDSYIPQDTGWATGSGCTYENTNVLPSKVESPAIVADSLDAGADYLDRLSAVN